MAVADGRGDLPTPFARLTSLADVVASMAIIALGAWVLVEVGNLREGPGYAAVSPRLFPILVGVGFLLSGASLLVVSLRARTAAAMTGSGAASTPAVNAADTPESEAAAPTDWGTLLGMALLLGLYVAAYLPLGFILTSVVFHVAGAWILGSRALLRDVLVALLLSVTTYVVFTRLLGLELPAGLLEEPLRAVQAPAR